MTEQHIQTLAACFPTLAALHVVTVEVTYAGGGDQGAIEEVLAVDESSQPISLPIAIRNQIADSTYGFLPPGFELETGGNGTLTLDVTARHIRVDHNYVTMTTENRITEYDLNFKPEQGGCDVDSTG